MKKYTTILMTSLMVIAASTNSVCATETNETNLKYEVKEGYVLSVPGDTTLSNEGIATLLGGASKLSVTNNLIPNAKSLSVKMQSKNGLKLVLTDNEANYVSYEVSKTMTGTAFANNSEIMRLDAGTVSKSQDLYIRLSGSPRKSGEYKDVLTFTAEIIG